MNSSTPCDGFTTQWQCRQRWKEQVEKSLPDDETFVHWIEKAQLAPVSSEIRTHPLPFHRSKHWIPYAAAASIVFGVAIIGLSRRNQPADRFPMAKEVMVESQTIHFLCNNGCSAQDIMLLANKVIK